jgi:SAM-dependent methyltransferase
LFSYLGAKVFAVDVALEYLELAHLNAKRYGINDIEFLHVEDTRQLPFGNDCFDFVSCNSVLEYVDPGHLSSVQAEIGRTVKVGGRILVTGTSNRLWPKEVHSEKWLVNYLPRSIDRIFRLNLQRGTWPWKIRYGFGKHYENLDYNDRGRAFMVSRFRMGGCKSGLQAYVKLASWLGVGPGLMSRNIACLLEKKAS